MADDQHAATKAATLTRVMQTANRMRVSGPRRREAQRQDRQQHQRQHHREVLDDQPADGDAAALGVEEAAILQGAQQHDGAGDREREAEDEPAADGQPTAGRAPTPSDAGDGDLDQRAGHRDARDRQQILQREMQADAEHQQDDADLGELAGERLSATKPGVNGPTTTPASR